jgi:hypothetical protein
MKSEIKPQVILTIGMHRSGTSMLTRICNLLGVHLGENLSVADASNEKGYWENLDVLPLNNNMFYLFGLYYFSLTSFPVGWENDPRIIEIQQQIIGLLKKISDNHSLWGIKDPRICRLLPSWFPIFETLNREPIFIIPIRNPRVVMKSLHAFGDLRTNAHALMLWIVYNLDLEKYTRGYRRSFVHYDDLCVDWKKEMSRVTQQLEINWPNWGKPDVEAEIATFITPKKQENTQDSPNEKGDILYSTANYIYELLLDGAVKGSVNQSAIDGASTRFYQSFDSLISSISFLSKMSSELLIGYNEARKYIKHYQNELANVRTQLVK